METLVGRFRKLFTAKKQRLPAFIEVDVDPKKSWNILEDIGEGAFGAVKKVSRKDDTRIIAAYKCTEVQDGEEVEDLAIEVEILLACKYENVVGILAAYFHDNCLSVMLEYCAGGAVDQIMIELEKALTEPQIASITHQVCNGLAFLHSKYVIHRDLKAGNILLASDGTAKIADFGVSTMLSSADEGSNTFIGTPHWMSPEVIRCETMTNMMYNSKADIWSLGITCIQLAQKEPPFHELSAERVRLKILRSSKPPTLDRPSAWSSAFRDFLARCLMINPDERCSAVDLLNHPFIAKATEKKPIVILLLEMSADFCEEPVFENSGSCADSITSSDRQSLWSRQDETIPIPEDVNRSPVNQKMAASIDNEQTPVVDTAAYKKKRLAPAPPPCIAPEPVEKEKLPVELKKEPELPKAEKMFTSNDHEEVSSLSNRTNDDSIPQTGHMSPSGQEVMEILDDLNVMLDENYHHSSSGSRCSSQDSLNMLKRTTNHNRARLGDREPSHHSSIDSISENRAQFENGSVASTENGSTIIKCVTPTHSIRDIARNFSVPGPNHAAPITYATRAESLDSGSTGRSKQDDGLRRGYEPVLLQVNADDEGEHDSDDRKPKLRERITSGSSEGSYSRTDASADIPQGLVKKHRELAQKAQIKEQDKDVERIKEQRRREDAVLFGEQHSHVSDLAASITSKLSTNSTDSLRNRSTTTPVIRAEAARKEHAVPRPSSMPQSPATSSKPPRPASDASPIRNVPNYNYFADEPIRHSKERQSFDDVTAPPPEPPVDYDETPKAPNQTVAQPFAVDATPKAKARALSAIRQDSTGKENAEPKAKHEVLVRRTPSRQTATKKTRTFTVDGVQMTSTTMHALEAKQNYELRREQEREYLRMQREEARQRASHEKKSAALQENQEKNFNQEKMTLERSYIGDIDMIAKTQKKKIEDLERNQDDEIRQMAKRLKSDQEKHIRAFKEQLSREQKILKQEMDLLPKGQRKDIYRMRKDQLDKLQMDRELDFLEKLDREHELFLEQLRSAHREKMALTERQFLEHKHQLEQSMMSALWELEERQLSERQTLNLQQLKELYLLQRSQMMARHQKEQECIRRTVHDEEDRLMRDLSTNRKNLPKSLRVESKTRVRMFKESLHIDYQHKPELWDQLIAQFEESEKQRVKATIEEYEQKCKKRMDALVDENQRLLKELEQIHAEKRAMLCENEQHMIAECEIHFQQLLQEARSARPGRKADLERRFKEEMEKQMKFYNIGATSAC